MDKNAGPDPVAEAAGAMLRRGQTRQAISYLMSRGTLSVRAADYLCDAYFQDRDWGNALAVLRAQLQLGQATPYRRKLEAKILSNMDRHEEALACARAYMDAHGEDVECLIVARKCCLGLGDVALAQRFGQQALLLKDKLGGPPPQPGAPWRPRAASGRVIAYSVWGTRMAYLLGAAINTQLAQRHFPGWSTRLYCHSTVAPAMLDLYRRLGAQVVLADLDFPEVPTYFWRFLVADDPQVLHYLCRDADCRLGAEEALLVAEWLASGRPFHVVRDNLLHTDPMLAGLWGGTGSDMLKMRELIAAYFNGRPTTKYGHDQEFLGRVVWPRVRGFTHVHDRHYATPGVESHRHAFGVEFGVGYQDDASVAAHAARLGLWP